MYSHCLLQYLTDLQISDVLRQFELKENENENSRNYYKLFHLILFKWVCVLQEKHYEIF